MLLPGIQEFPGEITGFGNFQHDFPFPGKLKSGKKETLLAALKIPGWYDQGRKFDKLRMPFRLSVIFPT